MLARATGIDLHGGGDVLLHIGGGPREVSFHDVSIEMYADMNSDEVLHSWNVEIGFFRTWEPPWQVLLGQVGFFDTFTVTMNRSSTTLAVEPAEVFDERFGPLYAARPPDRPPRFTP